MSISEGEVIRMSTDVVQFRLYSAEAVHSFTQQHQLQLAHSTLQPGKLFACNFLLCLRKKALAHISWTFMIVRTLDVFTISYFIVNSI